MYYTDNRFKFTYVSTDTFTSDREREVWYPPRKYRGVHWTNDIIGKTENSEVIEGPSDDGPFNDV